METHVLIIKKSDIMDLKQFIPFDTKEFRIHQEESINKIIESIEDGNKFTILNAPVGSGKSLIGYIVAKYLEEQSKKTYLCTGTKILQSQYIQDFKDVQTIKGRMNFDCLTEPLLQCSNGMSLSPLAPFNKLTVDVPVASVILIVAPVDV